MDDKYLKNIKNKVASRNLVCTSYIHIPFIPNKIMRAAMLRIIQNVSKKVHTWKIAGRGKGKSSKNWILRFVFIKAKYNFFA